MKKIFNYGMKHLKIPSIICIALFAMSVASSIILFGNILQTISFSNVYVEVVELKGKVLLPINKTENVVVQTNDGYYVIPSSLIDIHVNHGDSVSVFVDSEGMAVTNELHKFNDTFYKDNMIVEAPEKAKSGTLQEYNKNLEKRLQLKTNLSTSIIVEMFSIAALIIIYTFIAIEFKKYKKLKKQN